MSGSWSCLASPTMTCSTSPSGPGGSARFDRDTFSALCDDIAWVARSGGQARLPVVVTSGAVALGVERLRLSGKPKEMALKQAAAAAGQSRLMRLYDDHLE